MSKRRKKRMYEVAKRCQCPDRNGCLHHWWLRVHANGRRQRVDLNEVYTVSLPTSRDDMAVWAAQAKQDAHKGLIVDGRKPVALSDTRPTFGDVADKYVEARGGHRHYYLDGIRATEVPAANGGRVRIETKAMADVTTADIRTAIQAWRARKRTKNGVRGGIVAERHMIASARHLFSWSIKQGFVSLSPLYNAQGRPVISISTKGQGRARRLEPGEEDRITKAATPFMRDFFAAMLETGCRPGELRTLQWADVHDDHLVVIAAKAKDKENRSIPVLDTLRTILGRRRIGPDGAELGIDAYVFGNETGDIVNARHLCTMWQATCRAAHVTDLHLHDLRREFASQLSDSNVPVAQVRDALGHSNITMTSRYLGISREGVRSAYHTLAAARAARRSSD